ncbi:hypothetical protein ACFQVA_32020 [Actinomadura keratinilytica]
MPVGGPEAGHREERAGRGGDACADAPGTTPEREIPPGAEAGDHPSPKAPPPGRAEDPPERCSTSRTPRSADSAAASSPTTGAPSSRRTRRYATLRNCW